MRKVAVLTVAMLAVAGFAFGNSIVVPFFLDDGNAAVPTQGNAAGFIGLVNTSTDDVLLNLIYVGPGPTNRTDPNANTYLLTAGSSVSWRPGVNDGSSETPEDNTNATSGVPNMTDFIDIINDGYSQGPILAGSCIIYWTAADERAIKGRYVQNGQGGRSFAYFLGEGRTN